MANLQCGPPDIKESWKDYVICVLIWFILAGISLVDWYIANKNEYQSKYIPWGPLSPSCSIFIRDESDDRCSNTIAKLPWKKGCDSGICLNDSFEKVEKVIKPAGSYEIINKMSDSVGPYFDLIKVIKPVFSLWNQLLLIYRWICYNASICHFSNFSRGMIFNIAIYLF